MSDDPSYVSYCVFCQRGGIPLMDYETWARTTHKLSKGETEIARQRQQWLAQEKDSVQRSSERKARRKEAARFGANG
jgi:hypothetical protein